MRLSRAGVKPHENRRAVAALRFRNGAQRGASGRSATSRLEAPSLWREYFFQKPMRDGQVIDGLTIRNPFAADR
jgi:hypothetical protein